MDTSRVAMDTSTSAPALALAATWRVPPHGETVDLGCCPEYEQVGSSSSPLSHLSSPPPFFCPDLLSFRSLFTPSYVLFSHVPFPLYPLYRGSSQTWHFLAVECSKHSLTCFLFKI